MNIFSVQKRMLFSVILVLAAVFYVFGEETCSAEEIFADNLKQVGLANNHFAINLHRKLSAGSEDNVFFSPFTLSSVLTLLYHGARGSTAQELRRILGFHRTKLEDDVIFTTLHIYLTEILGKMDPQLYTIKSASAVIVDRSFRLRSQYKLLVRSLYNAYVEEVNIAQESEAVVKKLNSWVKDKTEGMIDNLIDGLDPESPMVLMSASFFKASWRTKFDPKDTKNHPFYNDGYLSDKSDVPMMHKFASYRYHHEEGEFQAIELIYEGKNMSMVIFLPDDFDGLPEMEQFMSPGRMASVRRSMISTKVHLTLPKFKLSFNKDVTSVLKGIGLTKVFGSQADLSGMTEEILPLSVGKVKHKAVIDVNEKGSIVASASASMMVKMLHTSEEEPEFKANHPFMFAIFDTRSTMILFMGRVNRLSENY